VTDPFIHWSWRGLVWAARDVDHFIGHRRLFGRLWLRSRSC